ncbi:MAG: SPOR domain-containing protein [Candidatus Aminicenantales bacterium]
MKKRIRCLSVIGMMALFCTLRPADAQKKEEGIHIQSTNSGVIEAKPQSSITLTFRVSNGTNQKHEFSPRLILPEGWRLITEELPFQLGSGEETIRLVGIFVPLRTLSGDYSIIYSLSASDNPSLSTRQNVQVRVLLESNFILQFIESPRLVIAGEKYRCRFLLTNQSNASFTLHVEVDSQDGYPFQADIARILLKAGDSVPFAVTVETDPKVRKKITHRVRLKVKAEEMGRDIVQTSASSQVDVVPKVSGEEDYYYRLPIEFSLIALTNANEEFTQFRLSGTGNLKANRSTKISFLFRGPGRKELLNFGFQHEEYWLSLETPIGNFYAGDRVFSLSKLTEYGHYGRGFVGELTLSRFGVKAYYQESLFTSMDYKRRQKALQVSYAAGQKQRFSLSYLSNKTGDHPEDSTYSFQTNVRYKVFNMNFEYARGIKKSSHADKTDQAIWLEAYGQYKSLHYQLNIIQAGANYPGSYNNLVFRLGNLSFSPLKNITLRSSYQDQRLSSHSDLYLSSISESFGLLGIQTRVFNNLHFSLDFRSRERKDLSPVPSFHYIDRTVRFGIYSHFGSLDIQAFMDIGKTYNQLSQQSCNLAEYMASISYVPIHKLTLGGHLLLRDQDKSFTGERQQGMELQLDMSLNLQNTVLRAFFRTTKRREFYSQILEGHVLDDPLLITQHLNLLEVSLTQRFSNGHSLAFRLRGASPMEYGPQLKSNFMGAVEYTIPLSFPVSRKTELGELRGRVYNVEKKDEGIRGVIVKVSDLMTITNARGEFIFHSLPPGKYYMSVDKKSIDPDQITLQKTPFDLDVEGGKKIQVNLGLARSCSVNGQVVVYEYEKETQEPTFEFPSEKKEQKLVESYKLRNTLVEMRNPEESFLQATDDEGQFHFEDLRPGQWTLKIYDNNLPELYVVEKDVYILDLAPGSKEFLSVRVIPEVRIIRFLEGGEISVNKVEGLQPLPQSRKAEPPQTLRESKPAPQTEYTFQLGSFLNEEKAEAFKEELQKKFKNVYISKFQMDNIVYYRVLINFDSKQSAMDAYLQLKEEGYTVYLLKKLFD